MTRLPGGLRVITDTVPGVQTVALGVWVGVGTRHEDIVNNGTAHLVEHMLFKGTAKRSAQDIVEAIEDVGGNTNAYTSRELTSYHIHLLKDDMTLALDVLADMVQNASLLEEELEKERHVVLQEIGMCNDTPDDMVFDNYFETAYPDQSLGAPILGKAEIVGDMDRAVLVDYIRRFYTPGRIVVSAAGAIEHESFAAQVGKAFGDLPPDIRQGKVAAFYEGGENRCEKALEQSHVILGFQGVNRLDDSYYAMQALSTLLGGGMSSRLFQEIREKRGLVYSIYSFTSAWMDDGQFGIYAGTGPDDLPEMIPVLCDEIKGVVDSVTAQEVERAKAQIKASMLMARESMMSRADRQARHLIFRETVLDEKEILDKIEAVNAKAVGKVAKRIFSAKPTLAGLGPLKDLESFQDISGRLTA